MKTQNELIQLERKIHQQNVIFTWLLTSIGALVIVGICIGMSIVWIGL